MSEQLHLSVAGDGRWPCAVWAWSERESARDDDGGSEARRERSLEKLCLTLIKAERHVARRPVGDPGQLADVRWKRFSGSFTHSLLQKSLWTDTQSSKRDPSLRSWPLLQAGPGQELPGSDHRCIEGRRGARIQESIKYKDESETPNGCGKKQ